jgi:hypothetical protein
MVMAVKSIRQLAYVCNAGSFNDTLDFWHRTFDAGPFWVTDVEPAEQIYDGRPTSSAWRLAVTYIGQSNIEIVAPLNDAPSVWSDGLAVAPHIPPAGLFHHIVLDTDDFDARRDILLASGAKYGMSLKISGRRVHYVDAREILGCFVELVEWMPWTASVIDYMKETCATWDGKDELRSYNDVFRQLTGTEL